MTRATGEAGIRLIKDFESLELDAYQDGGGVWSIGYGHTEDVSAGSRITEHQAEILLRADLAPAEEAVNRYTPCLGQNRFDACVSLAFNIGGNAFGNSALARLIRKGDYNAAAQQFAKWNHDNGKVIAGLTRRRAAEAKLFATPDASPDFSNVESGIDSTATKV